METIKKEQLEEALLKFCESFRDVEKQKCETVAVLIAGSGTQDTLDAFKNLEEKQSTLFALVTSIFESYRAEVNGALQLANASVHASSAGLNFKETEEAELLPQNKEKKPLTNRRT